jgi:tRNA U34 5-carboxymethylaminomethyl modifying GTPase MnmE/TrmE
MDAISPKAGKSNSPAGEVIGTAIRQAVQNLSGLGSQFDQDRDRLEEILARLEEERFHLAVLGQFKRGKSSLINALLGEAVLPTAVIPLTAIPTFIRAGDRRKARISFVDGRPEESAVVERSEDLVTFLSRYVSEPENPKNRLGVAQVEVFHPAELLRHGVVLIDTPGIGSTFRHNTEATLNFLVQCDAALFVSSADPPITEVEVSFLKDIRDKIPHLIFLFNKADYLDENDKQTALAFFRIVLEEEAGFSGVPVYCVSARRGLEARRGNDPAKWEESGLRPFSRHLVDFFIHDKAETFNRALALKTSAVLSDIGMQINIVIRSLKMPIANLEQCRAVLDQKLADIERQRTAAQDLLAGDQRRTTDYLEKQAENLRHKARNQLMNIVRERCPAGGAEMPDQEAVEQAMAAAIPGLFERELGEMSRTFDRYVSDILRPHQQRAEELIDGIRRTAADLFAIPYHSPEAAGVYQMKRRPYWVAHKWPSAFNPIPLEWTERLLPQGMRRARLISRLESQVDDLVTRNVENLRWATLQNLNATFRQFSSGLNEQLALTLAATQGAIRTAWEKRQSQADTVAGEIDKYEEALERFAVLAEELSAQNRTKVT